MKNLHVIFILCSAISFQMKAQVTNIPTLSNEVLREKKYTEIEGSAYLYDDWKPGTIVDQSGKSYNNVQIKYDAHKDLVEINQDGKIMVLNKSIYRKFIMEFVEHGSNNIIKHEFSSEISALPGNTSQYYEILVDGEISLIKKYDIKFINEVVNNYGTAAEIKRFQRKEIFFLVYAGNISEIKMNTKSILSVKSLPTDFRSYLNDNKVKIKNQQELIVTLKLFQNK